MKRILVLATMFLLATAAMAQVTSVAPPVLPAANTNAVAGPGGLVSTVSGLTVAVSPGPIYCGGETQSIKTTNLTLPASSTIYIWYDCSTSFGSGIKASATFPGGSGIIILDTTVTGAASITSNTDNRIAAYFPLDTDGYFLVPPSACSISQSGGTETVASVLKIVGNIQEVQEATTTTTATDTVVCAIVVPSRIQALHGAVINDVTLLYGNSVGAIGTCNAPAVGTQTAPAAGTSETAAAAALVTAGAVTVTPVVGSCNTAAVTAGQVYSEKVALSAPLSLVTDMQTLYLTQSFIGPASASFTLNVAGVAVHYTLPQY